MKSSIISVAAFSIVLASCSSESDDVDCTDLDADGYGIGSECLGLDCAPEDSSCSEGVCCGLVGCLDEDGDGYGVGSLCLGLDCNDSDPECATDGAVCCVFDCVGNDVDADGYGFGDCPGLDCKESDPDCSVLGDACCNTGDLGCLDLLLCMSDCTLADFVESACIQQCVETGDTQAQLLFEGIMLCAIDNGCDVAPDLFSCVVEHCEVNQCLSD